MIQTSLGLHLLLIPDDGAMHIPSLARPEVESAIHVAAAMHEVRTREQCVREDHIHILIEIFTEEQAAAFIAGVIEMMTEVVVGYHPEFRINERVHVTLLPPAHLEIMASFIRDQERYHSTHSLDDEVNEIFRPTPTMNEVAN